MKSNSDFEVTLLNGDVITVDAPTEGKAGWPSLGTVYRNETCLRIEWKSGEVTVIPLVSVLRYDALKDSEPRPIGAFV